MYYIFLIIVLIFYIWYLTSDADNFAATVVSYTDPSGKVCSTGNYCNNSKSLLGTPGSPPITGTKTKSYYHGSTCQSTLSSKCKLYCGKICPNGTSVTTGKFQLTPNDGSTVVCC